VNRIAALAIVFSSLSLVTLGGGMAAFPQLKRETVDQHRWLTEAQLDYLYSAGQMAPGPNMMMIAAIGERVAGLPGAVVVVVAFLAPAAVLAIIVGRLWIRLHNWRWMPAIQRGLRSISIGLLLAGCATFGRGAITDWTTAAIAAVTFAIVLRSRINPAFIVLAAGLVGVAVYGHAAPVAAQTRSWSVDYGREQAAVSTNGVDGTWTVDRLSAMWSRVGRGGWLATIEHQRRYGRDDVALLTSGYRRAGDWTFGAAAAVAPDAVFLCRAAAGGEVSYRAIGALVVSGGYHFERFPSADIHQVEPAVTWYGHHGEVRTQLFVTRDASHARTSTTFLLRGMYDVGPRLRFAAGGSAGDRIFNIDPSFRGAANGWLGFAESRLGFTDRDFVVAGYTAAHEQPAFEYVAVTLGYRREF